eukprot:CAMPEP_0182545582 /NCGR_PEP_ID=MMETSP1323-20130603/34717_1 /TAXON_ID=236787 /ORGANISM="Florenciella parvula, Strain RCC1693" /LENGTH=36 /DNA_ID= /DNA_START= /DNA_END= /DNA_ORIENTATION=
MSTFCVRTSWFGGWSPMSVYALPPMIFPAAAKTSST